MNPEYFLSCLYIRHTDNNLSIKSARTQQSRIQHIRSISCGKDNDAGVAVKSIHLHKQLVQSLLTLIVTATEAGTSLTAYRINFIDKDDTRCILLSLFKQIPDTGCTNSDEHLDKVRS